MNSPRAAGLALAVALLAAGCSDLGRPIVLTPHLELSATAVDFGTVAIPGSSTRTIVIGNSGTGILRGTATLGCAGYSFVSGGGPFAVPPGSQLAIVILYQPTSVGASPCELSLGEGLPAIPLSGNAALQSPGAQCQVSVSSLDFGFLATGGTRSLSFVLRSTGTAPVNVDASAGCTAFSVVSNGGPHSLAPGDSLVVTVGIVTTTGGHFTCTIATGPGCPQVSVIGDVTSASFSTDLAPIISGRCRSCHVPWTRAQLVNQPVFGAFCNEGVYVTPYDPAQSVFYLKLTNPPCGSKMPQSGGLLAPSQISLFQRWIAEGAHAN